ncbi:MAG: hypothetical protein ACJAU3_001568, partial [Zhongshania sp.]
SSSRRALTAQLPQSAGVTLAGQTRALRQSLAVILGKRRDALDRH